jgi:hypothetical protein
MQRLTIVPVVPPSSKTSTATNTEIYRWMGDVTFHHQSCEDTECCGADPDDDGQMDGLHANDLNSSLCGNAQRRTDAISRQSDPKLLVASLASEVDHGVWKLICRQPGKVKLSASIMYQRSGSDAPVEGRRWVVYHTNMTTPIVEDSKGALEYV